MSDRNKSKSHTNGVRKSQQRNPGQRPDQQNKNQGKGSRASTTRAPVAVGNKTYSSKPRYRNLGENMIVAHNEYIGDIVGSSSAFSISKTLILNPGNRASFPWLASIASRYESYKFIKLNYRFLTERPTTESGYVALVPDYDPSDAPPLNKTVAFQYESTAKSAPWENVTMVSRPQNLSKRKSYFVRTQPVFDAGELPLADTGNLFVCVGGNSGAVTLGELWCDYEVMFMTPQIDLGADVLVDSLLVVGGGTFSLDDPFGTAPVITLGGPDALFASINGASVLTFAIPYRGLLTYNINGTGLTGTNLAISSAILTAGSEVVNATGTVLEGKAVVTASAGQNLDFRALGTTVTGANCRIGRYSAP